MHASAVYNGHACMLMNVCLCLLYTPQLPTYSVIWVYVDQSTLELNPGKFQLQHAWSWHHYTMPQLNAVLLSVSHTHLCKDTPQSLPHTFTLKHLAAIMMQTTASYWCGKQLYLFHMHNVWWAAFFSIEACNSLHGCQWIHSSVCMIKVIDICK